MSQNNVRYLVFDIESVSDGSLVSRMQYPGEGLEAADAIARYRAELMEKYDSDFVPYTFQIPISVVVAKISAEFELLDMVSLDEPEYRPHIITNHFWRGWEAYQFPTLVSFNGRTFDMPLMELAAFRFGLNLANWFDLKGRSFEQPRNRYNVQAHLDLHDVLTNFGAARFKGGLNLAANLLGKPGKMEVQGHMVQDLYDEGQLDRINDYCRCDVLDTYFVFLRTKVLTGALTLDGERDLVMRSKQWLEERRDQCPAYLSYLEQWGDWVNPWLETASVG